MARNQVLPTAPEGPPKRAYNFDIKKNSELTTASMEGGPDVPKFIQYALLFVLSFVSVSSF